MKKNTKSARKILTESLPAPTAGTEWKFRMVIRHGDVIGVKSLEQEVRNIVSENLELKKQIRQGITLLRYQRV